MLFLAEAMPQTPYSKIYLSGGSYQMNLIELSSQSILMGWSWYPGISILDEGGHLLHTKGYYGDSVLIMSAIRRYNDNEFYFCTSYRRDSCAALGSTTVPYTDPAIGRMDSLGSITDFKRYRLTADCGNFSGDLEITANKEILVWGKEGRPFVLKVDSLGDPLWAKRFIDQGSIRFLKELSNGDVLLGFDMDSYGACIARLDGDGNFIWCKSYMRPWGQMHDAVIESDSTYVITGYAGTLGQPKLFMMKIDQEGEVLWCRGYDPAPEPWYLDQWSRIERTLDGNYAVLATLGQPGNGLFYRPFLMKTNPNGDTLWTRSMGADGYIYHTRDLLVHSDGSYMFSGVVWGTLPDSWTGAPFIFKVDSLGHFSCSERVHTVQVSEIFPTDSSFTLVSMDGATVHPAFVNDTTFAPIQVYDACEVANALRPAMKRDGRVMSVRPNPNTGHFTLSFADPLMAESYYSVYDTMGKLLFQRPLPQGKETEEVDLSRFGAGTYVVRFTSKEGSSYERVLCSP